MSEYVHDEWCDLDDKGTCECYVSLLQEKDKRIAELEHEVARQADVIRHGEYIAANKMEQRIGEVLTPLLCKNVELEAELEQLKADCGYLVILREDAE